MKTAEKVFLNQSQLVRQLGVARATLNKKITSGEVSPDAVLVSGHFLYSLDRLKELQQVFRTVPNIIA